MPRVSPALLRRAGSINRYLAHLLPVCRDLQSAQNELRWLREHAQCTPKHDLSELVRRRAEGEPLQYILGSEYFGDLGIVCRPGVLIPRQETAESVSYLVQSSRRLLPEPESGQLRLLDICTGSGCIPLLFHHDYYAQREHDSVKLDVLAFDISDAALSLAQHNKERQLQGSWIEKMSSQAKRSLSSMEFIKADMLDASAMNTTLQAHGQHFDVLTSNPPYISRQHFWTITGSSVRKYEPKLALVPPRTTDAVEDGDQFYPRLWKIADQIKAKTVLFEVGDLQQATRVADMAQQHRWDEIELWRDAPEGARERHSGYDVIGDGNVRSVFARRKDVHQV